MNVSTEVHHRVLIFFFMKNPRCMTIRICNCKKVQVGKDQKKAQSEKDSHSKNRGGKKPN